MRFCIAYRVDCLLCAGLGLSTLGPESWRSGKTCCGTCLSPTSLRVSVLSPGCQNAFRSMGPHTVEQYSIVGLTIVLYAFSFSDWSLVLMFLRRNPSFLFALEAVFPMCSFHVMSFVMVIPRYSAEATSSRTCPCRVYGKMILFFLPCEAQNIAFCRMKLHLPIFFPFLQSFQIILQLLTIICGGNSEIKRSCHWQTGVSGSVLCTLVYHQ